MVYRFTLILNCVALLFSCKHDTHPHNEGITPSIDTTEVATNVPKIALDSIFRKVDDYYILPWSHMVSVQFEKSFHEKMGMEMTMPIFSDTLQALQGKNVEIEGFYIPVDETGDSDIVIVSAYPYSQCFFCGKAGIESIIDVMVSEKLPTIKTDRKVKFRGKLKLNRDDFDYLIYILENAVLVR